MMGEKVLPIRTHTCYRSLSLITQCFPDSTIGFLAFIFLLYFPYCHVTDSHLGHKAYATLLSTLQSCLHSLPLQLLICLRPYHWNSFRTFDSKCVTAASSLPICITISLTLKFKVSTLPMAGRQSSFQMRMRIICDQLCQVLQVNAQSSHCNTQIKRLKTEIETGLLKKKINKLKRN